MTTNNATDLAYRDSVYADYDRQRPSVPEAGRSRGPYARRLIAACFPPQRGARTLDLRRGGGVLLYFPREAGYTNCLGGDISPSQVAAARELGVEVRQEGLNEMRGATFVEVVL